MFSYAPMLLIALVLVSLLNSDTTCNMRADITTTDFDKDLFFSYDRVQTRAVGLNLFYSGINYTEKDWVRHKVRHYPLLNRLFNHYQIQIRNVIKGFFWIFYLVLHPPIITVNTHI